MSKSLGPLKDETTVPENSDLPTPNRYWITWLLWILASTVGFCFSLAPLFILVMFLGYYSAQLSPRYSVIFFIIGASGGLILGLSQWIFLRSKIQKGGIWIIATSISWGLSTFLLFPELIGLSLKTIFQSDYVPAAIGGIVGLCQCLVLRLHVRRASLWILFNIIGYTSAFLLINFISANTVLNFAIFVIAVGIIISMSNGIGFVFLFDKSLQNLKHAGILTGVSLFIVLTFSIPIGIRGNQQLLKIEQYPVTSLAFSPDGKVLAAASIHGEVKLWDVETGQEVNAIKVTSTYDVDIAYSPDGNTIAIVTDRVRLWDLDTGQLGKSFTGSPHGDDSIDFSPDGKVLATLKLYEIFLWDVDDGQIVKKLNLDQSLDSVPSCLAFSPAGDFLAIGQGATVQIWSVETGQELNIFRGFDGWIRSVDISPDGKLVATGANSAEHPVRLWDISSGMEIHRFENPNNVEIVAFSPDGKLLAVGYNHPEVELYDVTTGQIALTIKGHIDNVDSIAFSPDGKLLATAAWDGTIRIWDISNIPEVSQSIPEVSRPTPEATRFIDELSQPTLDVLQSSPKGVISGYIEALINNDWENASKLIKNPNEGHRHDFGFGVSLCSEAFKTGYELLDLNGGAYSLYKEGRYSGLIFVNLIDGKYYIRESGFDSRCEE